MSLPLDIETRVRHEFPAIEAATVIDLLAELQNQDPRLFDNRVLRCIVYLAGGSFSLLAHHVSLARQDFRDVILFAEHDLAYRQVRDLTRPFQALNSRF